MNVFGVFFHPLHNFFAGYLLFTCGYLTRCRTLIWMTSTTFERNLTFKSFITLHMYLPRLPQVSDALSFVKEILQQLTNQRASIEEDIQSSFEDLHKQLDVRKSVLLMELEVTYGLKQKVGTLFHVWHTQSVFLPTQSASFGLDIINILSGIFSGPPSSGGQPRQGWGGHHGLLYPDWGGSGWRGVCGQSAGRAGAEGKTGGISWDRPSLSARGEWPAGSADGDRRAEEVHPQPGDHRHHQVRQCWHKIFKTLLKSIYAVRTIWLTIISLNILSAVASQSEAMGAGLEQCIVGHPASVTIVTRDKSGGACKSGNAILSAEVCLIPSNNNNKKNVAQSTKIT